MKLAYRVDEFMEAFGVGRVKTYDLLNTGKLEKLKSGKITLISTRSIERWMDQCAIDAKVNPQRVGQRRAGAR